MTGAAFVEHALALAERSGRIPAIRAMVVDLATTGRLTAPNEADGSGVALLQQIASQRQRLLGAGKIRQRSGGPVAPNERPFHAPAHWAWCRLSDVGYELGQTVPTETFTYIDVGGIDADRGVISDRVEVVAPQDAPSRARKLVQPGTVIYSTVRPYLLNIAIVEREYAHPPIASTAFGILHPFDGVDQRYLFYWLRSRHFTAYVRAAMKGMAYPAINDDKFYSGPIALPPLAEQKRIVAKVDELMALCDRLEAQLKQRDEQAGVLAKAAVARFQADPTVENLEYLFHASYTITAADLQRALLNLAVRGQLVKQAPADPATDDLISKARIEVGLETWHGHDPQPREIPFEIPKSWRWVTVEDVSISRLGKMLDKGKNRGLARPYLRNTNVHWFRFELESIKEMAFEAAELDEYRVEPGDVLICEGGHGIARSAVWDGQLPGIMFQKALHRVRPLSCLDGHYLTYCLWVFERAGILQRYYTGAGIPHFTGKSLSRVLLPLPPLAEQRRIVAKVNQLMALVDQLESQITASEEAGAKLLDALVAELAPSN